MLICRQFFVYDFFLEVGVEGTNIGQHLAIRHVTTRSKCETLRILD